MATETKATVFKQFTLKASEVGKAAVIAGISAGLLLIGTSINAGRLPTIVEWKAAGIAALVAGLGVIVRDFTKPTVTVIKGQDEPVVNVHPSGTVTATDGKQ